MLLAGGLYYLGEVDQLAALLVVDKVGETLAPAVFKLDKDLYQLNVVFELGVYNFDVLLVLSQEAFEVLECLFDTFGQIPYSFRLSWADSSVNAFSG